MTSPGSTSLQQLKQEWSDLQPLSAENSDRLWKKLRLEWNYHSNHLEGSTLTYGDIELLLISGDTRGNHTIREYEEMKGHDVAISHVRDLATDGRPLSEADVRNLNKLVLKEPFWKEAATPDGTPTRKQIVPGQYNVQPNNVRTATGEMFSFVDRLDVPSRMEAYVRLVNEPFPLSSRCPFTWPKSTMSSSFSIRSTTEMAGSHACCLTMSC